MSETLSTGPDTRPLTTEQQLVYDSYFDERDSVLDRAAAVGNVQDYAANDPAYYNGLADQINAEASATGVNAAGNPVTHENDVLRSALDESFPVWQRPPETGRSVFTDSRKAIEYAVEVANNPNAKFAENAREYAAQRMRDALRQDTRAPKEFEEARKAFHKTLYGERSDEKFKASDRIALEARDHAHNWRQEHARRAEIVHTGNRAPKPKKPFLGGITNKTRQAYAQQKAEFSKSPANLQYDVTLAQRAISRAEMEAARVAGLAEEDAQRYFGFEEIWMQAAKDVDPMMLEARYGTPEDLQRITNESLTQWFRNGDQMGDNEQAVFAGLHTAHSYLKSIDEALQGMPPSHRWYNMLVNRRAELAEMYNRARYRKEFLRLSDNMTEDSTDFSGRIGAKFHPDAGIELDDGTGVVLYPDGSYRQRDDEGVERRYTSNNELWQQTQVTHAAIPNPQELAKLSLAELRQKHTNYLTTWFQDPSNVAAAEEARAYIDALTTELAAQVIETNDADQKQAMTEEINQLHYWMAYLRVEPGVESDTVRLAGNGAVYSRQELHGEEGTWKIWPSGHAYLLDADRLRPDGSFDYQRRVGPDGQDL